VGYVGRDGERFAAACTQFAGQSLDAIGAPGTQHDGCALRGEMAGGRLAQPAACAGDNDDLSFDIVAHDLDSCLL
jgi:hypothetical protein